jgi:hypothetical protein
MRGRRRGRRRRQRLALRQLCATATAELQERVAKAQISARLWISAVAWDVATPGAFSSLCFDACAKLLDLNAQHVTAHADAIFRAVHHFDDDMAFRNARSYLLQLELRLTPVFVIKDCTFDDVRCVSRLQCCPISN